MSRPVQAIACACVIALIAACGGGGAAQPDSAGPTIDAAQTGDAPLVDAPQHAATLVALQVTPATSSIALGTTQQYTATGIFSDASSHDITTTVTWSTDAPAKATAAAGGAVTAVDTGTVNVIATDSATGVTGSAMLTVTAAHLTALAVSPGSATVAAGGTQQFTATGTFSDQTTQDLTIGVRWTVTAGTASIANPPAVAGLATSHGIGSSTITARDPVSGLSATATLTVSAAALVSISVTPATPGLAIGGTQQFTAIGTFSDATTSNLTQSVTWSSSTAHATITATGLATAVTAGSATIKALDPTSAITGTATLTVAAAAPALSAFGPAGQFTSVGHTRGASFPQAISVSIAVARAVDTPVTVTAPASVALTAASGGSVVITIPAGQTSAAVPMTGVTEDAAAELTATTGTGATLSQSVQVIDYSVQTPKVAKLAPATVTLGGGDSQLFTVTFDLPVQVATAVPLTTTNATEYSTAPPASVTVLANQQAATFTATASATATGTSVITAGTQTATVTFSATTACTPSQVVISQVYGGGGNSGSLLENDFVELFNRGTTDVDLSGFEVWIASATGTFTTFTTIASGQHIAANHYYLIGEAKGAAGTLALPTPDTVGTIGIAAAGGKVVLVGPGGITTGQTCPSTGVIDLVGAAGANCFATAVGPAGTATLSIQRADGGCTDTSDNATDFAAATADPRNSGSAAHSCPISCGE